MLNGFDVFLVKIKGIPQVFHHHRIFGVAGEGLLVRLDGLGKLSFLAVGNSQFIEKKGTVVFLIFSVRFEEGYGLVIKAALIQQGGLFSQAVVTGKAHPLRFLSANPTGEEGVGENKGQKENSPNFKKIGEEPLSFP